MQLAASKYYVSSHKEGDIAMTSRVLMNILVLLSLRLTVWSQPMISVFPDSINLWMEFQGTRIDSFRIANIGQDTLRYRITWGSVLDTSWYSNSPLSYTPVTVDSLLRASVYRPMRDLILLQFKYFLYTQNPIHLEFFLFESSSLTGNYRRIFSRIRLVDSLTFNDYVSSGSMALRLHAGYYYAIGVAWDQPVQYRSPGGVSAGSNGLGLSFRGNFSQTHTFPSDTTLVVSAIQSSSEYDINLTGGFALWLQLLTDSSGMVAAGETTVIPFSARDPGIIGRNQVTSYFNVYSNDPIDSLEHVAVSRRLVTRVDPPQRHEIPARYELEQNFPNPFNPSTTIKFSLPHKTHVSLKVLDVLGREVATLTSGNLDAGLHTIEWNTERISSGVYLYRLQSATFLTTKRMMLLK